MGVDFGPSFVGLALSLGAHNWIKPLDDIGIYLWLGSFWTSQRSPKNIEHAGDTYDFLIVSKYRLRDHVEFLAYPLKKHMWLCPTDSNGLSVSS